MQCHSVLWATVSCRQSAYLESPSSMAKLLAVLLLSLLGSRQSSYASCIPCLLSASASIACKWCAQQARHITSQMQGRPTVPWRAADGTAPAALTRRQQCLNLHCA